VLAGGFVVLRGRPGTPRPEVEPAQATDRAYEDALAILEEAMVNTADREG
jgi:hypothetical protein